MVVSIALCSPSLVLRPGLCHLFYILEPFRMGHGDNQDLANIWIFSRTILREWFLVGEGKSRLLV